MSLIIAGTVRVPPENIARFRPHMETMLAASRAEDGCEVYSYAVDIAEPGRLSIADGLNGACEIVAIAQPHQIQRFLGGQHRAVAGTGMIGVPVGDHGPLDRAYRVDMEASRLAAQSGGHRGQEVVRTHPPHIGVHRQV